MATTTVNIEVCFASETAQFLIPLQVAAGTTVIGSIMLSHILDHFPEIELSNNVGIFSKKVDLDQVVNEGDRIEIYRPLSISPNQLRLRRAVKS